MVGKQGSVVIPTGGKRDRGAGKRKKGAKQDGERSNAERLAQLAKARAKERERQVEQWKKKRGELEKGLSKAKLPERPRQDQKGFAAARKKYEKAKKELGKMQLELEKCNTRIAGAELGISDIIDQLIFERAMELCQIETFLRDFQKRFQKEVEEGLTAFIPPLQFCGTQPHARTLPLAHAAVLCHDLERLKGAVVDSCCAPPAQDAQPAHEECSSSSTPTTEFWYSPEQGQLNTPLHFACMFSDKQSLGYRHYREVAQYVIDTMPYEAVVKANLNGDTALHLAADAGATELVMALCGRGVRIDSKAVCMAAASGRADTCIWLVRHMLDNEQEYEYTNDLQQIYGVILHVVAEAASKEDMSFKQYKALMDFLLVDLGLDINTYHGGETPLHIAAKEQNIYFVCSDMMKRGADSNALDRHGRAPSEYVFRQEKGVMHDMFDFFAKQALL